MDGYKVFKVEKGKDVVGKYVKVLKRVPKDVFSYIYLIDYFRRFDDFENFLKDEIFRKEERV